MSKVKIASLGLLILGSIFIVISLFQIYGHAELINTIVDNPSVIKPIAQNTQISQNTRNNEHVEIPSSNEAHLFHKILYPIRPTVGENIGNLSIPAIDHIIPIFHGTNEDELEKGIGHFVGSVLPGESDNAVLSGHRDTVLRKLGQLQLEDQLIVETAAGIFTYEIKKILIVDKDDKTIISPTDHAVLTVTTCYPFDFIGLAPDRYILIADLII